jgi:hypothetical protein
MRANIGGQAVRAGYYWNPAEWSIVTVSGQGGGVLPGGDRERYFRVPVLAVLLLAPVMGGLFVMFLPFIGFAMLLVHGGGVAGRVARRRAAALAARLRRSGPPVQATLGGGRPEAKAPSPVEAKEGNDEHHTTGALEQSGSPRRAA